MSDAPPTPQSISDEDVIVMVKRYLSKRGLSGGPVTLASRLEELGIDSMSMAEMLINTKQELVESGVLAPGVTPVTLPTLNRVSDLAELLRELAARSAQMRR